jgi:hypothetical protein
LQETCKMTISKSLFLLRTDHQAAIYKVVQIWPGQTVTCIHTTVPVIFEPPCTCNDMRKSHFHQTVPRSSKKECWFKTSHECTKTVHVNHSLECGAHYVTQWPIKIFYVDSSWQRVNVKPFYALCHYFWRTVYTLYSRTSNNGHCRGIQILSVIGGVR